MKENQKNNQLAKAIYSAVAYFDIFDYPLDTWGNLAESLFWNSTGKKILGLRGLSRIRK